MDGIIILLIILALTGFFPLAIVLYKRRLVQKIIRRGISTRASVYHIYTTIRSPQDVVHYVFIDAYSGQQYKGSLVTKTGVYKTGDTLTIFYLKENPNRNTVEGAWKSQIFLWFTILLAFFVLLAVYKIYREMQAGHV